MEIKDYLIVYGFDTVRGGSCYKESIIDCNELIKYSDLIKRIIENKNDCNWVWTNDLVLENNKYVLHHKIYELYSDISHDLLDSFSKLLPGGITRIESIKIFSGEKIKII